jgi:hypothetical protein
VINFEATFLCETGHIHKRDVKAVSEQFVRTHLTRYDKCIECYAPCTFDVTTKPASAEELAARAAILAADPSPPEGEP